MPINNNILIQNFIKIPRFNKEIGNNHLEFREILSNIKDLVIIYFCDIIFDIKINLISYNKYLVVAIDRKALKSEKCRYNPLAWKSFKFPRVCRSSLNIENQIIINILEKIFIFKIIFNFFRNSTKISRTSSTN